MIKIRLQGNPIDVEIARHSLEKVFRVITCSGQYPDKGESDNVRMYLDVEEREAND